MDNEIEIGEGPGRKRLKLSELIHPSKKQAFAFQQMKKYKYLLYGGAMFGGKSFFLRWALVKLLIAFFRKYKERNIIVGLFCEDYPSLKDRQVSKMEKEFPLWLGTMHGDHKAFGKCFILAPEYGSGVIVLRNLDDPAKYQSAEFAAIAVDELTKNDEETFIDLRHRLRWPGIEDVKFIAGTNPGSKGHLWVRKYFIDKEYPPEEKETEEFVYVPAKYEDNPFKNSSYDKILNSLPPKMQKAYKEGDWDIFAGQFFTEWKRDLHTCVPYQIPNYWQIFLGLDYGFASPSAVYWAALDVLGRVIVYRELYGAGMTYTTLARMIEKMTPKEERDRLIGNMVADPAIFRKEGYHKEGLEKDFVKSGSQEMMEATNGWLAFTRGNNDRINGWGVMREYMQPMKMGDMVSPRLIFFNTCRNAVKSIPAMVHSETGNAEDMETDNVDDHPSDSCRYLLMEIHDRFSEKPREAKKIKTAGDIFESEMKIIQQKKLEQEHNIDWMSI